MISTDSTTTSSVTAAAVAGSAFVASFPAVPESLQAASVMPIESKASCRVNFIFIALFGSWLVPSVRLVKIECGIDAIAQTAGLRPVFEDVTEVRIAIGADNFLPDHAMAQVTHRTYPVPGEWQPETGPAGPGVELVVGAEKLGATADALVNAIFLVIQILAAERSFRALHLRDLVLLLGQA